MFNHLSSSEWIILGYIFLTFIMNAQAIVERMNHQEKEAPDPPTGMKMGASFIIVSFITIMFVRGFVLVMAFVILKNIILKTVSAVLFISDYYFIYSGSVGKKGEALPVKKTRFKVMTFHLMIITAFILFFFFKYLLLSLSA
ncbi:hypothetical protein [Falsibacillus albus]|uniref:Uncharacterized protein n=1 Tax=Falsibacillus albus TaxID=2478915 RepID=A0A3L7JX37_9BACI|nr:hypothetical protein [Falsibacillus albus]RLQ94221.1 hypothetical protein D9X91_14240 [Falsibacillus albus]